MLAVVLVTPSTSPYTIATVTMIDPPPQNAAASVFLGFGGIMAFLVRSWTKLDFSVGAVARVKLFVTHTEFKEGEVIP